MNLNPEHKLIPFGVSPLPAGPWLVFAPHADDETFGMGGAMVRAKEEHVETQLVVVTDGALGGDRDDLVAVRKSEVEQAAELLGISQLYCWAEPDRGVEVSQRLMDKAAEQIRTSAPASVFFPAPMELHPDHRATAYVVWGALQQLRQQGIAPAAFGYEIGVQNPVNYFIDMTAQKAAKEKVMDIYASQNSENNYPELVLALNKGRTFSLPPEVEYAEGFYRFSEEELAASLQDVVRAIVELYL